MNYQDLPTLNAILNGSAAAVLLVGFAFIKRGKRVGPHKASMLTGLALSSAFLTSYLIYHFGYGRETPFEAVGWIRTAYYVMLVSHVFLAALLVPLVGTTLWFALRGAFERHRKIARWTFPIWMYVSVTGVLVYLALYGGLFA